MAERRSGLSTESSLTRAELLRLAAAGAFSVAAAGLFSPSAEGHRSPAEKLFIQSNNKIDSLMGRIDTLFMSGSGKTVVMPMAANQEYLQHQVVGVDYETTGGLKLFDRFTVYSKHAEPPMLAVMEHGLEQSTKGSLSSRRSELWINPTGYVLNQFTQDHRSVYELGLKTGEATNRTATADPSKSRSITLAEFKHPLEALVAGGTEVINGVLASIPVASVGGTKSVQPPKA